MVARGTPAERDLAAARLRSGRATCPRRRGELLIFLRDGQVARFADYRGLGRFTGFATPIDALPRARAVLRVRDLVVLTGCGGERPSGRALRWRAFAFACRLCWCGP